MVSNQYVGKKVLLSCINWFAAPDGKDYMSVHGTFKGIIKAEGLLGFKPRRQDVEWYISIGDMLIAGCQVNYAVLCENCCDGEGQPVWHFKENGVVSDRRPDKKTYITH